MGIWGIFCICPRCGASQTRIPSTSPGREGEGSGAQSPATQEGTAHACGRIHVAMAHNSHQSRSQSHSPRMCHLETCVTVQELREEEKAVNSLLVAPSCLRALFNTLHCTLFTAHLQNALLYLTHISQAGSSSTFLPVACLTPSTEVVLAWLVHFPYLGAGYMTRPCFWTCPSVSSHNRLSDYFGVRHRPCSHG